MRYGFRDYKPVVSLRVRPQPGREEGRVCQAIGIFPERSSGQICCLGRLKLMPVVSSMKTGDDPRCSREGLNQGGDFRDDLPLQCFMFWTGWLSGCFRLIKGRLTSALDAGARKPLTSTLENWAIR